MIASSIYNRTFCLKKILNSKKILESKEYSIHIVYRLNSLPDLKEKKRRFICDQLAACYFYYAPPIAPIGHISITTIQATGQRVRHIECLRAIRHVWDDFIIKDGRVMSQYKKKNEF
jgi:hypothetical protein